jgi:hypothetical protein
LERGDNRWCKEEEAVVGEQSKGELDGQTVCQVDPVEESAQYMFVKLDRNQAWMAFIDAEVSSTIMLRTILQQAT